MGAHCPLGMTPPAMILLVPMSGPPLVIRQRPAFRERFLPIPWPNAACPPNYEETPAGRKDGTACLHTLQNITAVGADAARKYRGEFAAFEMLDVTEQKTFHGRKFFFAA